MKKRTLIRYCIMSLIVILMLIAFVLAYVYWGTSNHDRKNIALSGPHGKVIIQMDNYGVPHISALDNDLDAFFALGYIHAKDRLWQMEFQRNVVAGTLSEVFGEATIPQDKFLRTWGFYRAARTDWDALDDKTQAIINSYTAGVNQYLTENTLPLQFLLLQYKPKAWTHIDSIAWGKMIAWQLQNSWQDKIENYCLRESYGVTKNASLKPPYPATAPTTLNIQNLIQAGLLKKNSPIIHEKNDALKVSNIELFNLANMNKKVQQFSNMHNLPGKGSNNWVVSGKHTKSGKPILSNDIHLELSAPILWYLAELKGPHLHVMGASIPGIPSIIVGRNEHIAWGITNAGLDAQDIYLVPKNEKTQVVKEIIRVKNREPLHYEVKLSSAGPIINEVIGADGLLEDIAIRWTALLPGDTTAQSFLKINYAQNWQQFTNALKDYVAPSLNFVYADIENNIGYYLPGLIPIRKGWNGKFPVPLDAQHQWEGFVPFEHLPNIYNPKEGIIISANNKPVPDAYPYQLTYHWIEMPYRAARLNDLLKNTSDTFDVATMMNIQNDTKNYLWSDLKPILLKTIPLDSNSQQALTILKDWEGDFALNSVAATVYSFWFQEIKKMQPKPSIELLNLTNPLFLIEQLTSNGEFCRKDGASNCAQYLSMSLQNAMQNLITRLGPNERHWHWGKVHGSHFKALGFGEVKWLSWIWNRSIATPGDPYTINAGTYDNDFTQVGGATYRQIIDLPNIENSYYIQALGQSDNPLNKHYDDQMTLWKNGQYIKMSNENSDAH